MTTDLNLQLGTDTVLWDLQPFYPSAEAPALRQDMCRCLEMAELLAGEMTGRVVHLDAREISAVVERLETIDTLLARLSAFAFLHFITQTDNAAASALIQKVEELEAAVGRLTVFFRLEWNLLPAQAAEQLLAQPELQRYRHYLQTLRHYAGHQLSSAEEQLLQALRPVGRSAWNLLFEKVFGQLRFGARRRTEEEVLSDLYSPDREVRKNGAEELTRGLSDNLHILAHIFNTLAAEKMIEDRLRQYPSWSRAVNLSNEIEDRTVETLVEAVCSRYDLVHRYYRMKRELLGYPQLFDYDRYAPIPGEVDQVVAWEQCRGIVLSAFGAFAPEMATNAERFFTQKWIHAPIFSAKRGGAFAHPCVPEVHPYILVNYTGNIRDVATVAHELGHGVHQLLAANQGLYNSETSLVLAETASVFAELLVFRSQLQLMPTPAARCALICQKLESIFATVFRQVAMFRFEEAMHNGRREAGELSAEQLSHFWLETQRPMFGDALTLRPEYGLWWAYISHFLGTPGYVYAYAFGELLVLALYARYVQEGEDFVSRYLHLLRAGGSGSPATLLQPFAIDLNDPEFWLSGLNYVEEMLAEAERECRAPAG